MFSYFHQEVKERTINSRVNTPVKAGVAGANRSRQGWVLSGVLSSLWGRRFEICSQLLGYGQEARQRGDGGPFLKVQFLTITEGWGSRKH